MPSDGHSQQEMMSQLLALKELITDKLIVSVEVDSSVMDPETLCFATNEQMRKVITNVIDIHRNSIIEVTKSAKYPEGKRRLGTCSLDHIGSREVLIGDMIEEMQRVVGLDLETRVNKADIARSDAAQKFTDFAESLIPIVAELFRIEKDRSVALCDGNSGRVQMIRGISGLSPEEEKEKWLKSRIDGLTH